MLASAQRFAAKGAEVILVSRNEEKLAAAQQKNTCKKYSYDDDQM